MRKPGDKRSRLKIGGMACTKRVWERGRESGDPGAVDGAWTAGCGRPALRKTEFELRGRCK
jgi:hypothetical protein